LRQIVRALLGSFPQLGQADLGILLVAAPEMTRLNETFLRHAGPTDVIAFDYRFGVPPSGGPGSESTAQAVTHRLKAELQAMHAEIFVCVDEAVVQARRFRTTWQSELVRYIVHGVLHLRGHDDQRPAVRRKMKREENHLLRLLAARFHFDDVARPAARAVRKS
jgi:probable rRNA maturation factor